MPEFNMAAAGHETAAHGGTLFELFGTIPVSGYVVTSWAIMLVIVLVAAFTARRLKKIPSGWQALVEWGINALIDLYSQNLGREKARQLMPVLGTMFIFIIFSNYSGLLPGAGNITGFNPPTGTLSVTAGLGAVIFMTTHYLGMRQHGVLSYFGHFTKPFPVLLPLNIVEEIIRPVSLSLRLFGNIFGEEMLLAVLLGLVPLLAPVPIMGLDLIFGFIQAFIFTVLASVYFASAIGGGH